VATADTRFKPIDYADQSATDQQQSGGSLALGALSMVLLPALATTPFVVRGLGFRSPFEVLRAISIMLLLFWRPLPPSSWDNQFRSQTENSEPPIRGDGMALGGLGIGYVSAALSATFIVFMVVSIPGD